MKNDYKIFTEITKEILDTVKVGNLIKVNDWKKPLKVIAVSENYFVMARKVFGEWEYSVCEKKPWGGIRHNAMIGGKFHIGTDGWVFGSPTWLDFKCEGYDFGNAEASQAYINSFELPEGDMGHSFISPRNAVRIARICIKSN